METPLKDNLFLKLFFGFIVLIIAITLLHESGHYLVSVAYGNKPDFHYNSVTNNNIMEILDYSDSLRLMPDLPANVRTRLWHNVHNYREKQFYISLAGPMVNMLIGTLGFVLLFALSKRPRFQKLKWGLMFMTLFWIRQLLVFPASLISYYDVKEKSFGDEEHIANYLNWPFYSVGLVFFLLGILMIAIPMFRFFSFKERSIWLLSAFFGGIIGCVLWFYLLGPYVIG